MELISSCHFTDKFDIYGGMTSRTINLDNCRITYHVDNAKNIGLARYRMNITTH